jgi:hypothetical protein
MKYLINCVGVVQLLSESYNPHVRYGAAMALGIACAGTGNKDALALIEPMKNDPVNYVRQVRAKPLKDTFYVYLGKVGSICTGKNWYRSCKKREEMYNTQYTYNSSTLRYGEYK